MLDSAVFDRHIRRMRILLAALSSAALLSIGAVEVQAQAPLQAQAPAANPQVAEVERYFNGIRTLQARFVQSNPNGTVVQGTLSVSRPGRMRFEYDPPSQLKIVADGSQVTMWDIANRDFGQWPIGWTAASFLVREPLVLQGGDLTVEKVERADGMLQLTMSQTRKPNEGKVIVRVNENPMVLRGWSIIDNRGQRVDVSLNGLQTGLPLAASLFKFDGPDAGAIRRGVDRN
jgi:outer membrane lipoprotein-sorting protein